MLCALHCRRDAAASTTTMAVALHFDHRIHAVVQYMDEAAVRILAWKFVGMGTEWRLSQCMGVYVITVTVKLFLCVMLVCRNSCSCEREGTTGEAVFR